MEDLSLHILDIAENSVAAGATRIEIIITEDTRGDLLVLEVTDNGVGMDAALAAKAVDPFTTTRTTRRVGLGLPLLEQAARAANGSMDLHSTPGAGTRIVATFQYSHMDRKPLGNMPATITTLLAGRPDIDISYRHERDGRSLSFTTEEVRRHLDGSPLTAADTLQFIKQYLMQEEESLTTNA